MQFVFKIPRKKNSSQLGFFFGFEDTLNPKQSLYILVNRVDWQQFENAFLPICSPDYGRPAKPIRLMVVLLMLKHTVPCKASELFHLRMRIVEQGIALEDLSFFKQ